MSNAKRRHRSRWRRQYRRALVEHERNQLRALGYERVESYWRPGWETWKKSRNLSEMLGGPDDGNQPVLHVVALECG